MDISVKYPIGRYQEAKITTIVQFFIILELPPHYFLIFILLKRTQKKGYPHFSRVFFQK